MGWWQAGRMWRMMRNNHEPPASVPRHRSFDHGASVRVQHRLVIACDEASGLPRNTKISSPVSPHGAA